MPQGLSALAEAAEAALRGAELSELEAICARLRKALVETLSDVNTSEMQGLLDAYRGMVMEGLSYLAEALLAAGRVFGDAELAARAVCGLAYGGDGCLLVELASDVSLSGRLVKKGSIVCLEPPTALLLDAAGLAKVLLKEFGAASGSRPG